MDNINISNGLTSRLASIPSSDLEALKTKACLVDQLQTQLNETLIVLGDMNDLVDKKDHEINEQREINNRLSAEYVIFAEKNRILQSNVDGLIKSVEGFQRFFDQNYFIIWFAVTLDKIERLIIKAKESYHTVKERYKANK